jgi:hypothetical protein
MVNCHHAQALTKNGHAEASATACGETAHKMTASQRFALIRRSNHDESRITSKPKMLTGGSRALKRSRTRNLSSTVDLKEAKRKSPASGSMDATLAA